MSRETPTLDQNATDWRLATLRQDIRSVDWGKQVLAFHINTKLAQLVSAGCDVLPGWLEACEKFVACLPDYLAICGERGVEVDPFRGTREAFPSNRKGHPSEIPQHVADMWKIASGRESTFSTGLYHGNLVEILETCGILKPPSSQKFYKGTLGMTTTPAESIDSMISECDGEVLIGNATSHDLRGGKLFRIEGGTGVLWEDSDSGLFLLMEGYGCICRWRVIFDGSNAVVIQSHTSTHTSVTNMAEQVRDACLDKFGSGIKCYEFYEPADPASEVMACEITGSPGEIAGWLPTDVARLDCLANWLRVREVSTSKSPTPSQTEQTST